MLNIAVVNYADIRQLLRTGARGEQLLKVDIEDFVHIKQLLKIIDLEESQSKEGLYGKDVVRDVCIMRKPGKAFVFNELIDSGEYLYTETRQCEVNLKQGVDSRDQIEVRKDEIRMSQKDGMMLNLQYGTVELEMSSRDDSNMIIIVLQGVIDEEESEDNISEADKNDAMILKDVEFKLLEGVFQVSMQVGRILSFQEICGVAGILRIEVKRGEAMNEKLEEGTGIVARDQWRRYWHRDYDVLMQEHIQL